MQTSGQIRTANPAVSWGWDQWARGRMECVS